MPKAEIRFSTVPGSIPTVADLDGYKFGYNKADAILYGVQLSGEIQSVVALTGSGSSHTRLHAINDPLDHAAVSAEYRDKILHTSSTTGIIDFISFRNDVRASGSTDNSVVTETGIRAAIDAAVGSVTGPWAVSGANIYNTNSGNVGIGTNNPAYLLDIAGSPGSNALRVKGMYTDFQSPSGTMRLKIQHGNDGNYGALTIYDYAGSAKVHLGTGGNTYFNGGNVGVGIIAPLSKLHINGGTGAIATGLSFGDGDTGIFELSDDALRIDSGNLWLYLGSSTFQTNANFLPSSTGIINLGSSVRKWKELWSTSITDNGTGNVGIGTTIPDTRLAVNGSFSAENGYRIIRLPRGDGATNNTRWFLLTSMPLNNYRTLNFRIVSSSSLGVAPNGQDVMHVYINYWLDMPPVIAHYVTQNSDSISYASRVVVTNEGDGYLRVYCRTGRYGDATLIVESYTSIGTGFYNVNPVEFAQGADVPSAITGSVIYDTSTNQPNYIIKTGKLGIGTNSPTSLLDVAGTVTAYTAKLSAVGTLAAAQLLGLDADKNLTTNVLPLVLSGIQNHTAGAGLSGSNYNGSAAVTWSVDFAGTGAANSVARSDHNHDLSYAAFGHNHYLVSLADVLIDSLANGQVLRYNSTSGVWENGNADQYWVKVSQQLQPATSGDKVVVEVVGQTAALTGNNTGNISSVGVRGYSDIGYGMFGQSVSGTGIMGMSTSSYGVRAQSGTSFGIYASSTSSVAVYGSSDSGSGGQFLSTSNYAIRGEVNNSNYNGLSATLLLTRRTSGSATAGIANGIMFEIENSAGIPALAMNVISAFTSPSSGSETSDFIVQLRNSGSAIAEKFRIKGNGDSYFYADSYQTKENGAIHRLRGYHNYTGTPGYLKSGDYAGSLVFDAWSGASSYASVGAISVLATADHNSSNFASKMEFWLAEPSSLYPRQVAELTPEGKVKGIYGFSVFGADGITGTQTIITGVSYDSGTKTLTFTRATLSVSGGIVTSVTAASNTVIPLS